MKPKSNVWMCGVVLTCLIVIAVIMSLGCLQKESEGGVPLKGEKAGIKEGITVNDDSNAPSAPMDLTLSISSFSDKIAEITVKIEKRTGYPTEWFNATNVTAVIQLPEGLELIEGDLNWQGDISGDEIVEFKVKVKAINNGEWKAEANAGTKNLPPYDFVGDVERLYVLISDEEVLVSDRSFTKPTAVEKAEEKIVSSPINVDLSISNAPTLNQTAELTCTVTSILNAPNTTSQIILPEGAQLLSGDLTWQGDLEANKLISFSARIVFKKVGNLDIEAVAKHVIDEENWWGDAKHLYLNIGANHSKLGFLLPNNHEAAKASLDQDNQIHGGVPNQTKLNDPKGEKVKEHLNMRATLDDVLIEVTSPGTVTAYGYFKYYDRDNNYVPARFTGVQLWDDDTWNADDYLGGDLTDTNGYWQIGPVENGDEGGTLDLYVHFVLETDSRRVETYSDDVYCWYNDPTDNVPDGNFNFGTLCVPDGSTNEGAMWIYQTLRDGWAYLPNDPGSCTVEWKHDGTDGTYYRRGEDVHLMGSDKSFPDVILHEAGHNYMWNIYGDWMPVSHCQSPHYINRISHANCAWTEGWANFYPLAVYNDPIFHANGWQVNLETPTWSAPNWDGGDACEGRVTGALWDLYDNVHDGSDQAHLGFDEIWDTIYNQNDETFAQYWSAWKSRGHNVPKANAAIFQNTIDYNNLPSCTITSPNGGWYSGTITVSASASDMDGSVSQVEFQYSQDGSSWHNIRTDASSSDGWSVPWDTGTIMDSSVWVRAKAFDSMEWSGWDDSDSSFGVDNADPSASISINNGATYTDTTSITMSLTYSDSGSGVDQCRYKNSGGSWTGWESCSSTKSWTLRSGDGTKTVYYQVRDKAGNIREVSDMITMDTTDPLVSTITSATHPKENRWYNNNDPSFTWNTPPDASGIEGYSHTIDHSSSTTPDTSIDTSGNSASYSNIADGTRYFHIRAKDNAGNWGNADHYKVKIDATDPSATLNSPNGGASWQVGTQHDITWTATDNVGITSVDIAYSINGGSTYPYTIATGETNDGTYSWTIPDTPSTTCKVQVIACDAADNLGEDFSNANFEIYVEVPPQLATYTITNRTITPPQTTEIGVAFSEEVAWIIAIEDGGVIYDWSGTAANPSPVTWDGIYEIGGARVPDGIYHVNVTGTSTTTGLSVANNTETIMVAGSLKGDLNLDGTRTSADAAIALQIAVSGEYVPEADIDGNGCVTSLDTLMIMQAAAGRIEL